MKPTHYLAIGVRLFSIVLALYGAQQLAYLSSFLSTDYVDIVSLVIVASTIFIPILAAIVLWLFPMTVANIVIKPAMDRPIESMTAQSNLTVLILALALYFLYYTVINAIYWISYWQFIQDSYDFVLSPDDKADIVTNIVELSASLFLLFRANFVSEKMLHFAK